MGRQAQRPPRLILVDGFTGSGKSTTAQRLCLDLQAAGFQARWYHEHEASHPIFQYSEVLNLLEWTPDTLEAQLVDGWSRLVRSLAPDATLIVEGAFLQIPVGVMLALGASPARIRQVLTRLATILTPHAPALVHLDHPDASAALADTAAVRGARWLADMVEAVGASPYGHTHPVRSAAGLARFYARQRRLITAALRRLDLACLTIDISRHRRAADTARMRRWLHIPVPSAPPLSTRALLRHAGTYRASGQLAPARITTDGLSLFLELPATPTQPLIATGGGAFALQSLPIDVRFRYATGGAVRSFRYATRMLNERGQDRTWTKA